MTEWIKREEFQFRDGERVLVALRYPDWTKYEIRTGQWFASTKWAVVLVEGYGWQDEGYVRFVMRFPDPPQE